MISHTTAGGREPGQAREVDGRLGVARALQDAARPRAQREDVPGLDDVGRARPRIDRDLDRVRPVMRRDAGRDARARLDRDREGRADGGLVVLGHHAQPELVAALAGEAGADQPAAVRRHEVDRLGRAELRGDREVALVLAILVVDHDHEAPGADVIQRTFDGGERGGQEPTTGQRSNVRSEVEQRHGLRLGRARLEDVADEEDVIARLDLLDDVARDVGDRVLEQHGQAVMRRLPRDRHELVAALARAARRHLLAACGEEVDHEATRAPQAGERVARAVERHEHERRIGRDRGEGVARQADGRVVLVERRDDRHARRERAHRGDELGALDDGRRARRGVHTDSPVTRSGDRATPVAVRSPH